jgi:PIN domain nuclease of toxin-antitoxin system
VTRLLLDTHLMLWWLKGDPRLPDPVVERVQAAEAEMFVSQASLWEMAIKMSIGRLRVDLQELERQVPLQGFRWLPIHNSHLLAVAQLEAGGDHRDPFDRLLVCQSRTEPMLLLTADRQSDSRPLLCSICASLVEEAEIGFVQGLWRIGLKLHQ